jgi:hypothetical protein
MQQAEIGKQFKAGDEKRREVDFTKVPGLLIQALHILSQPNHSALQRIHIFKTISGQIRMTTHPKTLTQPIYVIHSVG